jgi:hypothetical protein
MPILRDQACIAGIIVATTGVLLRTPLKSITGANIRPNAPLIDFGCPNTLFTNRLIPPDPCMPAATTYITATVINPELAKPASASVPERIPNALSMVQPAIITMCGPIHVNVKTVNAPKVIANENQPCLSIINDAF